MLFNRNNQLTQIFSLLNAESNAEKAKKGLWNDENADKATIRVNELQGDAARSKQFLPYLLRSGRLDCIVEFVSSGSRLRVFSPKESCLITFLLGSINCPRGARIGPGGKLIGDNEPYSEEALHFTKSNLLQQDVQIEVESMDKAGGFIGNLFVKNEKGGQSNFAELMVEQGLATVHFAAEKSKYYNQLVAAEERAKKARLNQWKNYVEEEDTAKQVANEPTERKLNLKKVLASSVYKGNLHFTAQTYSDGPAIESLMNDLQKDVQSANAEYKAKRGEVCACLDEHIKLWHRAKIESIKADRADVLYVDFGNVSLISRL
jgi:staphylococcal nuclease domain-containing protein 1